MATAPQAPRRSMGAPPAPPPQAAPAAQEGAGQSLYEYALECIRSLVDGNFAPQGAKEDTHRYFHRIGMALYEMPVEQFDELDPELKTWYDGMSQAVEVNGPIEPLQGYYAEEAPAQTASAAPAATDGKKEQPAGLAKWRAEQKALKEAQAAGGAAPAPAATNGHAPPAAPRRAPPGAPQQAPAAAPQAPAAPPRRMAPPAAPQAPVPQQQAMPQRRAPAAPQAQAQAPAAPQAPQRRAPTAPQAQAPAPAAPAPARRQQAVGRQQEVVDDLRRYVLANLATTPDELRAYSTSQGYVQAETTIGAICSAVKAIHGLMARDGWTLEAPAWYYEAQA